MSLKAAASRASKPAGARDVHEGLAVRKTKHTTMGTFTGRGKTHPLRTVFGYVKIECVIFTLYGK